MPCLRKLGILSPWRLPTSGRQPGDPSILLRVFQNPGLLDPSHFRDLLSPASSPAGAPNLPPYQAVLAGIRARGAD